MGPYHSIPVLKGWLQRGWKLSPHKEKTRQQVQVAPKRFHLDIRNFFHSENKQSLEPPHQGCGGVPVAGGFQDGAGQGATPSHLRSPSPRPSGLSRPLPQPGLLHGSVTLQSRVVFDILTQPIPAPRFSATRRVPRAATDTRSATGGPPRGTALAPWGAGTTHTPGKGSR